MGKTIKVTCPLCREELEVDVKRGEVVNRSSKEKIPPEERLSRIIKRLKEKESMRDKRFQEAKESLGKRKEELEKAFERLKQKVQEEGVSKPLRPIDLD